MVGSTTGGVPPLPDPPAVSRLTRVGRYLPVLALGRPLHGEERYRPFFIVGSGRCGTTLLRAMLEAHPEVHIPPETHQLGEAISDWRRYGRLPWDAVIRLVLGRFAFHPQWKFFELPLDPVYAALVRWPSERRSLAGVLDAIYRALGRAHKPTATRWGDKTPRNTFHLDVLHAVFPDMRAVHLVRDGRDFAESYSRLHSFPGFAAAAAKWLKAVARAQAFGRRHPEQYLEIRYEDLVREPAETLRAIARFLDLTYDERMLRYYELDLWMGDVDQMTHVLGGARRPIDLSRIGRWRSLDLSEQAVLQQVLGPTLARLGYEPRAV